MLLSAYLCVCLSVCLCPDCPKFLAQPRCILGLLSLQNTNRKAHAGSQTQWSSEVAETATKRQRRLRGIRQVAAPSMCLRRTAIGTWIRRPILY